MPTSRTFGFLALVMVAALGCGTAGCAADATDDGDDTAELEGELGASPKAAGIAAGSLEEEGVLLLVNDRATTADVLRTRTKLTRSVATAIVAWRSDAEGKPRWFSSIDEIDAIRSTGTTTFVRLVGDARASGYVEAEGFDAPTLARLSVPDNLGRPPTANDVTVEAGFDGKSPDEARALVRSRITNVVDATNERFVAQTIDATHKAFTIAVGNLFATGSPHATFARELDADTLTMIGTMSALRPTILVAEKAGTKTYYARGASGRYEEIPAPKYPVVMRAKVRLEPQGVRVFYPAWSAKVLSGPTTVITEGT